MVSVDHPARSAATEGLSRLGDTVTSPTSDVPPPAEASAAPPPAVPTPDEPTPIVVVNRPRAGHRLRLGVGRADRANLQSRGLALADRLAHCHGCAPLREDCLPTLHSGRRPPLGTTSRPAAPPDTRRVNLRAPSPFPNLTVRRGAGSPWSPISPAGRVAGVLRDIVIGIAIALAASWLALIVGLLVARPKGNVLAEAVRILPDLLRLLRRLAADRAMPRGVRVRLWLLMAYLAFPIDLIPDFIPVIGYADDAIIATAVLRSTVRRAGLDAVRAHWPGTDEGFAALRRLTGI